MIYLSTHVISNPEIAVGVYGHAVRNARYVVRLKIIKRASIHCEVQ